MLRGTRVDQSQDQHQRRGHAIARHPLDDQGQLCLGRRALPGLVGDLAQRALPPPPRGRRPASLRQRLLLRLALVAGQRACAAAATAAAAVRVAPARPRAAHLVSAASTPTCVHQLVFYYRRHVWRRHRVVAPPTFSIAYYRYHFRIQLDDVAHERELRPPALGRVEMVALAPLPPPLSDPPPLPSEGDRSAPVEIWIVTNAGTSPTPQS